MKSLFILSLFYLLASIGIAAKPNSENATNLPVGVTKRLKPRHDGKHYFISNMLPSGQPTVSEIDAGVTEAQSQSRIVNITSSGLSLPSVMKEIAKLPVTFRSTINDLSYDITVLSVTYTATSAYLSIGCRFTPPNSSTPIYFGSNTIQTSGKSGFIGSLPILESTLTATKSGELDDANGLLSGETKFTEFLLPGFKDNLAIGLGKASQLEFSCGAFGKFNLSGFVKAYSIVEKESVSGESLSQDKPLLLVFKDQSASDWKDLLLDAKVASAFHAKNYPDLGFHFGKNQLAQIDLSNYRNPANLPTCAQTAAENWQGVAFPSFKVRLPRFFNLRSGNSLALGEGKNLFLDANGLIGNVSAETVFSIKEGYTDEINKYDMSLDQLTATYSCNGQVTASMLGKIALPWCGTTPASNTPLLRYSFRYTNNRYEIFVKDTDQGSFSSNKYTLSTGSKITFSFDNNQFTSTAELTEKPTISTTAFNSSICRDFSATLNAGQCTNKQLIWSTGDSVSTLAVKPTTTTTYTVKCQDNYCVSSVSDSLKITVYESLTQPALTSGLAAFCRYEGTDFRADNCVGKIEWQLPGSTTFQQLGNDERIRNASFPNISQSTNYSYAVRCNLNGCISPAMAKTITVNEEPALPTLYSNASNNTIDRNGSVTISGNCANGNRLVWENLPQTTVSLASASSYYAVCRNDATGCQSLGKESITINVLYFPPAAPSNLTVSASGTDFINITWQDNSNNEDQFWIIRSANPSFSSHTTIGTLGPNTTSFRDNGLSEGVTWYYQVIAHNRYDNGYSNITSGGTLVRPGLPQIHAENTMVTRGSPANVSASCAPGTVVWIAPAGFTGGYRQQQDNVTYSARCVNSGIEGDIASITVRVCDRPGAAISVNDLTIPSGSTGQLSAQGCEGGAISWNTGSNQRTIDVKQAGYYTATCTVTNDCGTSSASDGGTVTIENKPCPLPTPSITVNDLTIKSGTSGTLSAYGCEGGSITWNTGFNGRDLSVSQAGYYTATCVVTNECGSGSASDGGTVTVTSCDPPATPSISVDDITIDENSSGTLTANGCDGGTIRWNTGSTDRSISVNQAGYYTATCTVSNSCSSSSASDGGTVTIRTCDKPATPWISVDDISIDENTSGTLRANGCDGGTIRWNTGFTERDLPVNQAGYYTATCTVSNRCGSSSASDGGTVTIRNKPCNLATPIIAGPDEVEKGQPFTLSITNCNESSGRVTWSPSLSCSNVKLDAGCALCGSIQATTTFNAVATENGCVSAPAYKQVRVRDCPTPATPSISVDDYTITKGEMITLRAEGCETGTIRWNNGKESRTLNVTEAGYYTATCTITNSCGNSSSASDGGTVKEPECDLSIPVIAGPTEVQKGEVFALTSVDRNFRGEIIGSNWGYSAIPTISGSTRGDILNCSIQETTIFTYFIVSKKCSRNSEPFTVTVKEKIPTPQLSYSTTQFCSGKSINIGVNNCSSNTFSWSNSSNMQEGIISGTNLVVSSPGRYTFKCVQNGQTGDIAQINISELRVPSAPTISGNDKVAKGETFAITASGCSGGTYNWSKPGNFAITQTSGTSTITGSINSDTQFSVSCTTQCTSTESSKTVSIITPELPQPSKAPDWRFYSSGTCANGQGSLWRDDNYYSPTYRMTSCCVRYIVTRDSNPPIIPIVSYIDCEGKTASILLYVYYGNTVSPVDIYAREGSVQCTYCTSRQTNY